MQHLDDMHPTEVARSRSRVQTQIPRCVSLNTQLFCYFDANNREELTRIVVVEHLSFSFGKKVDFVNYCQRVLNPIVCRVPRTIFTCIIFFIKKKKDLIIFF